MPVRITYNQIRCYVSGSHLRARVPGALATATLVLVALQSSANGQHAYQPVPTAFAPNQSAHAQSAHAQTVGGQNQYVNSGDLPASPWSRPAAPQNLPGNSGAIPLPPNPHAGTQQLPSRPLPVASGRPGEQYSVAPAQAVGQMPRMMPASAEMPARSQPLPPPMNQKSDSTGERGVRSQSAQGTATLHWGAIHNANPQSNGVTSLSEGTIPGLGSGSARASNEPMESSSRGVLTRAVSNPTEIEYQDDFGLNLGPAFDPSSHEDYDLSPRQSNPSSNQSSTRNDRSSRSPAVHEPVDLWAPKTVELAPAPPPVDPRWLAEQERDAERLKIAEHLSEGILEGVPARQLTTLQAIERPVGWHSIEQQLRTHMDKCEQLLRRNAIHSARAEISSAMRVLARTLDSVSGQSKSEPALDSALLSLKEECEFQSAVGIVSINDLVSTHTTPVLKGSQLVGVTPEVAAQHYRQFARNQFVQFAEQHPWAADLLYAYGKTLEKEADGNFGASIRLRNQAVIFYQAALQIRQAHPEASTQLGYTLLKLDRLAEAQQALNVAVQAAPSATNWTNLAEVYRRQGASVQANQAIALAAQWQAQANATAPAYTPENPAVTQIDSAEFAKYSPAQNLAAPVATAVPNATAQPSPPTERSAGFFSNLFK